jgi:hypothetical protein
MTQCHLDTEHTLTLPHQVSLWPPHCILQPHCAVWIQKLCSESLDTQILSDPQEFRMRGEMVSQFRNNGSFFSLSSYKNTGPCKLILMEMSFHWLTRHWKSRVWVRAWGSRILNITSTKEWQSVATCPAPHPFQFLWTYHVLNLF